MATQGLLKVTVFWNKVYGVIISKDDVINIILWHNSNFAVNVFMWPNFGNSSISKREVITNLILYRFDQTNSFYWGVVFAHVQ